MDDEGHSCPIESVATGLTWDLAARRLDKMKKLTPFQNDLISWAICQMAIAGHEPEHLKTLRIALVSELGAVTSETSDTSRSNDREEPR